MTTNIASADGPRAKSFTRFIPIVCRILLGLVFFVFGLNGFLNFIPQPKTIPAPALAFFMAMLQTGYLFRLLKTTEVAVGLLLLLNRFVPLALVLIAPVIVNIFAFHAFLEPSGLPFAGVLLVLEIYLAWAYRKSYHGLFAVRATPA